MELTIKNGDYLYKRDIINIFDIFKDEEDQLIFSDKKEGNIVSLEYEIRDADIKAYATAQVEGKSYYVETFRSKGKDEQENNKIYKQAISYVWVTFLESITGKKHDWGILTGIRPTKLYHKLYQQLQDFTVVNSELEKRYLLAKSKIELLNEIVSRQLDVVPDLYQLENEVSIYIGIPFCPTKCAYCTFPAYGLGHKGIDVHKFLEALHDEIRGIGKWLLETQKRVTTIYFGGGTPTSLEPDQIDDIFKELSHWINLEELREITVEAGRPDTITEAKLDVLKKWGVERISINPQTFSQETLDIIGRDHRVEEIIQKYDLARKAGFRNINMDLIIGLPGERLNHLIHSLDNIARLQPDSLTVHTMAFKRASFLTKNKEKYSITDPNEVKDMMNYTQQWTVDNRYFPYYLYRQKNMLGNLENVGYSRVNKESLYNILIMEEKQTIIGLGSGASSKIIPSGSDEVIRLGNPKDPNSYIQSIKENTIKKMENLKSYL